MSVLPAAPRDLPIGVMSLSIRLSCFRELAMALGLILFNPGFRCRGVSNLMVSIATRGSGNRYPGLVSYPDLWLASISAQHCRTNMTFRTLAITNAMPRKMRNSNVAWSLRPSRRRIDLGFLLRAAEDAGKFDCLQAGTSAGRPSP